MGLLDRIAKARAQNTARKEQNDVTKAQKSMVKARRNEEIAEAKTKAAKAKLKLEEVEARRAVVRAKKPKSGFAMLVQNVSRNINKASQPKRAAPRRKPAKKAKASSSQYITVAGKRYKAAPAKKKSSGKTVTFRID